MPVRICGAVLSSLMIGCGGSPAETIRDAPVEAFVGEWRSVTPSYEFIRLSVESKSSQQGVLATRLTFSGVAWEGSGRLEGDSMVASMTALGTSEPTGTIVARRRTPEEIQLQVRNGSAAALDLTLRR